MSKEHTPPLRMCVACRQMKQKRELIRLVRTPEGAAILDSSGKAAGRGAYLCREPECLRRARKVRALERALKCSLDEDIFRLLEAWQAEQESVSGHE